MNYPPGRRLESKDTFYCDVEEDMLFLRVLKQRGGLPSGKIFKCRIDFKKNIIWQEGMAYTDPAVAKGKLPLLDDLTF